MINIRILQFRIHSGGPQLDSRVLEVTIVVALLARLRLLSLTSLDVEIRYCFGDFGIRTAMAEPRRRHCD